MIRNRRPFVSFYFDEDIAIVVAKIIRAHGFKVVCASEVKECGITDETFMPRQKRGTNENENPPSSPFIKGGKVGDYWYCLTR